MLDVVADHEGHDEDEQKGDQNAEPAASACPLEPCPQTKHAPMLTAPRVSPTPRRDHTGFLRLRFGTPRPCEMR
jgi:hypothetical protein